MLPSCIEHEAWEQITALTQHVVASILDSTSLLRRITRGVGASALHPRGRPACSAGCAAPPREGAQSCGHWCVGSTARPRSSTAGMLRAARPCWPSCAHQGATAPLQDTSWLDCWHATLDGNPARGPSTVESARVCVCRRRCVWRSCRRSAARQVPGRQQCRRCWHPRTRFWARCARGLRTTPSSPAAGTHKARGLVVYSACLPQPTAHASACTR